MVLPAQAGTRVSARVAEWNRQIAAVAGETGALFFDLGGLLRCVRMLRGKKTWGRDCDTLRDEIVSFTREHTGHAGARAEVQFSLA